MTEALTELLRGGDSTALLAPDDGCEISHERLGVEVEALAMRLAGAGVRRGDRVALVLPNGPEIVELLFALCALGAAAAPLNPAYTRSEFEFFLADIEPRLMILPAAEGKPARDSRPGSVTVVDLVSRPGTAPLLLVGGHEVAPTPFADAGGPDDVALVLHTSGTTSRPKQVPLLQRNLTAAARTIQSFYRLGADDVTYCAMPLFHIHGLVASTLASLAGGGSVVAARRVAPRRFWAQARDARVTWLSAGPTLHEMLLDQRDESGPPSSLRFVRSCSSALSPALMQRAEELYAAPMLEAYGMTEASHQMASNPLPPQRRQAGSVGVPAGAEIRIVSADNRFLPDGAAGEVVIRGPGVTPGYLNNPAANAEAFFDGWFKTGDRGAIESGYLMLQGRLKELIIRGGENVSPAEIEEVLKSHPTVSDAACFGIPDKKYGELVGAAVALSGDADERELIDFCRERLTAVKVPSRLFVLPEIPRTPTGKLQRRRIADALLSGDS
jgi:acyl-CoA synthetase (AMP-forming)/AMP-acid ligase II